MNREYIHITVDRKALRTALTVAMLLLVGSSATAQGVRVSGSVYGGGNAADVRGNATVNIETGTVGVSVYGGGNEGSVGTFTPDATGAKTYTCAEGTGQTTVDISGDAEIGPDNMKMPDNKGMVFGASRGFVADTTLTEYADLHLKAFVNNTDVTIRENAFIKGSVYGGSENGHVLGDTYVKIQGGQIGNGDEVNQPYTAEQWASSTSLKACAHWNYSGEHKPYDKFTNETGTDGHTFYGNVFGGGSGYFPYASGQWLRRAGRVEGNTRVEITAGHVLTSVYGGNEQTDVLGSCTVIISGGTVGVPRTLDDIKAHPVICNVYGAGKGDERTLFNQWTNVNNTSVTISGTARIYGSVFGGGEDGHVLCNASTTISETPTIGTVGTSGVDGNVFGGGRGFSATALTAGAVCGDVDLSIGGGTILGSVFGGGRLASVGTYLVPATHANYGKMIPDGQEQVIESGVDQTIEGRTHGHITINMTGGTIGAVDDEGQLVSSEFTIGDVYGGSKGTNATTIAADAAKLGLAKVTSVTMATGSTTRIHGSVFGGGEAGDVEGSVTVNMQGGTVDEAVYGGGALAHTNTANWDATKNENAGGWVDEEQTSALNTTTVNLTGGTVGDAYGGGLGDISTSTPAFVWGDVSVTVNGTAFTVSEDSYTEPNDAVGTVEVKVAKSGRVFGCNNLFGTPKGKVTVTVEKTVAGNVTRTADTDVNNSSATHTYEIAAVYGGGNLAAYEPVLAESESTADDSDEDLLSTDYIASTDVIIKDCGLSSIEQVYGGGNAASTPSTKVTIYGSHEIGEVFGGGNGKDKFTLDGGTTWTENPGAHVGFKDYANDTEKASSKYGKGRARVNIDGGVIHAVYGGSNTKGNVRRVAIAMLDQTDDEACFSVDEAYGGGKAADMDGKVILDLGCIPGLGSVYGGARAATVNNDVVLNITNGTYTNVFGGNNERGVINGSITVNVEETGCRPVNITNLYGGGNRAAYPGEGASVADAQKKITVNVKSCTSIGNVFGGGLGSDAIVTGNTEVNINEVKGRWSQANTTVETNTYNEQGAVNLGTIGNVYGGGSQGEVRGKTSVNIGTESTVAYVTGTDQDPKNVEGVSITGSVYGGGLSANVVGSSEVKIGTVNLVEGATGVNIAQDVFGGGEGSTTNVSGDVTVEIGKDNGDNTFSGAANIGTATSNGSVYGGSAFGSVNTQAAGETPASGTVAVRLYKGTVKGAVYGGGKGEAPVGETAGTMAKVYGDAAVTLYGDVVTGGLYGGCDQNGTMYGNTELNLYGGTVGVAPTSPTASVPDIVFGGGLGAATRVNGNVTVNIGDADNAGTTIYSNVYGGSAKGTVNSSTSNTTTVNLFKGIIHGDVFGGGLGDAVNAATVKGNVTVNLNENNGTCVVTGNIFGCNNTKGTPEGHVLVHVFKTAAAGAAENKDASKTTLDERWSETATYDLRAVFGGGNHADYEPTAAAEYAQVIIEGCDETSIETVYGGGNAAATPATLVQIKGAYLINEAFGGGYGAGTDNPGANVGYKTYTDAASKVSYGTGKAVVELYGGKVHTVYGGSNTKGNIREGTSVDKKDGDGSCALEVKSIYGAGKNADMDAGTTLKIGCIPGLENVYGGAKDANIAGGVNLVITGGNFVNVFGGNDTSGTIQGPIRLYIEESCDAITIQNLYLGGNLAPYSVYGYYQSGTDANGKPTYAVRTATDTEDAKPHIGTTPVPYDAPELYVTRFTSIGNVYGGGYGSTAILYGNPTVNVNEVENMAGKLGQIGNVFGGGDAANIEGSTTVNIGTATTVAMHSLDPVEGVYPTWPAEGAYITGSVYGGGNNADVTGNTKVYVCATEATEGTYESVTFSGEGEGVKILGSVYGGGNLGSVGTFTANAEGKPSDITENTGLCTVVIMGQAEIGPDGMQMYHADENGNIPADDTPDDKGHVFGASKGALESSTVNVEHKAYVDHTVVTIGGNAFVKGSVYGGSENGHVLHDTYVYIKGGQIGQGKGMTGAYTDTQWETGNAADFAECASWEYKDPYAPYDPNANATGELGQYSGGASTEGGRKIASDGHTFYGNVFGGGSGSIPYFDTTAGISKYLSTAGTVEGDTHVEISGGHILTSVYGGCETTNVLGTANVTMTGGTIGVPRTDAAIIAHPVTGYLFGAGKGDQRVYFNKETNVRDAVVSVEGGRIYGSVYGGGEDGHVLRNVTLTIKGSATIGTSGTSYYDGNVFGGGRGFGGEALTAGNVGGAVTVNIEGGTMLGSVYGGGRLASVGYGLYLTTEDGYGEMRADNEYDGSYANPSTEDASTFFTLGRGKIFLNISGGIIGNDEADAEYGGNVFGGSMGRLTKLNGSAFDNADHWSLLATAKKTTVNVTNGVIKRSIYGGGELGTVTTDAVVNVSGGTIGTEGKGGAEFGNVYGGGKGMVDNAGTYALAGVIKGNADVTVSGGTIYHNIYGGGAYGTVGTFTYGGSYNTPNALSADGTGMATVTVTGGTIGTDGNENGMVFGSSRGDVAEAYDGQDPNNKLAWVNNAKVVIGDATKKTDYTTPLIKGSVYGGGENGHVLNNTEVEIHSGTIGIASGSPVDGLSGVNFPNRGNVYGGGCGTDVFTVDGKSYFNKTAGIVRGNATVTMDGGYVVRNIYGGGAMGSVGGYSRTTKGDDDPYKDNPYVPGKLGATATGTCTVNISGGKIGPDDMTMPINAGMVFGGGRGEVHDTLAYPNLQRVIYVNNTEVTISDDALVRGSVYGGSESGHVWGNTHVTIAGGLIGNGDASTECNHWPYEPNGSAYDRYADVSGYDSKGGATSATDGHTFYGNVFGGGSGRIPYAAGHWLKSAGNVRGNTRVDIQGGHILSSVYGGNECTDVDGTTTVEMTAGTIGVPKNSTTANPTVGHLFGAGKGDKRILFNTWTNVASTTVNVSGGTINGSVYGGGEDGHVLGDAVTTISGSTTIGSGGSSGFDGNVFGGGQGSETALTAGVVGGNVTLNMESGTVYRDVYGGGRLGSVGTFFADANRTEYYGEMQAGDDHGNIKVNLKGGTIYGNVYAACMGLLSDARQGLSKNDTLELNKNDGTCIVKKNIFGGNNLNGTPLGHTLVHVFKTMPHDSDEYHVSKVFGGGNQADYVPTDDLQFAEVIIEGCDKTKIEEVYGGGNAAATPATQVLIKGTELIDNVFGGGYGAGAGNPGANVGYRTDGSSYSNGTGRSVVLLMAGNINNVYGGSNTKGDIRGGASITNPTNTHEGDCCENIVVQHVYGGGKDADIKDGELVEIVLGCQPNDWIKDIYAGAENADVNSDVSLTLTSGKFGRVFGGNKAGGRLNGGIDVFIEENGECGTPIIIGELYGGGNEAAYSVYGYYQDGFDANGKPVYKPRTAEMYQAMTPEQRAEEGMASGPHHRPRVHVRSFTSIGNIYGGGYGASAVMIGSPEVNINGVTVVGADGNPAGKQYDGGPLTLTDDHGKNVVVELPGVPANAKMGAIGNVFGGGNAAEVVGDTQVNIGTASTVTFTSNSETRTVEGADIRGNVYGGGNEANVTGKTNVVIGQ